MSDIAPRPLSELKVPGLSGPSRQNAILRPCVSLALGRRQ